MKSANGSPVRLVEHQQELDALCAEWSGLESLALDTEFLRTNTFYARPGLLQIADPAACHLVDPLCIEDWTAFKALLNGPVFTMHSCGEDLNLLYTAIQTVPARIFDSQLAAAFSGLGFSLAYRDLVKLLLGRDIPKDQTRSDWLKRPLGDRQLEYAANDVCFLAALRDALLEKLQAGNTLRWFEQECAARIGQAAAVENRESWATAYTAIHKAWKLSDEALARLQQLCYWREQTARERNKPRNWIARDEDLLNLAALDRAGGAVSLTELETAALSDKRIISRYGKELLNLLNKPSSGLNGIDRGLLNVPLNDALRKQLKSCRTVVAALAEKLSMAPELLAGKRLLQELVRDYAAHGRLQWRGELAGWRRELLEPELGPLFQ